MQFREAISIRFVDEDRIRVWNIQAAFDDGRCQQNIGSVLDEVNHDLLQRPFGHLSVPDEYFCLRRDSLESGSNRVHVFNTVMHEENLAVPIQLTQYGIAN